VAVGLVLGAVLGAIGSAAPDMVGGGATTVLTAEVTPAPDSTGVAVRCDLAMIGSVTLPLLDDGLHGDGAAGDLTFADTFEIQAGTPLGAKSLPCTVSDAQGHTASFSIALTVISICGDGGVIAPETCDDEGTEPGDGCDGACAVEPGWRCSELPSVCVERCGDGRVVGREECDDDGHDGGDGCSNGCGVEDGWQCAGEPSVCVRVPSCGDGAIDGTEECDDGGRDADDGCDGTCTIESGWACVGEPSYCCAAAACAYPDAGLPDAGDIEPAGDGGCCSAGGDPAGALALLLVSALALRTGSGAARSPRGRRGT
jgi:cysteine-rich repeat protein